MKKDVTGSTYHSGKAKGKKPAIKLTSDKISVKSEDLKKVMTGDFIRCVDKDNNVKMIKVTIGKSLIDKNDKVIININEDSAKITVDTDKKATGARIVDDMLKSTSKKVVTTASGRKKEVIRTPFGNVERWVDESSNTFLFDEAIFVESVVQEEDDIASAEGTTDAEPTDASTEDMGEDISTETTEEAALDPNIKGATETGTATPTPAPMSAQTKAILNNQVHQEGFFTKKPKKLKPIGRDVVAYITCEMNAIHSSNDQAMLAGYTCSKIELVDWYITVLDTQDPKYIVPHTRQYLVTMKAQLESLLAQILKIRPINRSEQIWRVNYPTA